MVSDCCSTEAKENCILVPEAKTSVEIEEENIFDYTKLPIPSTSSNQSTKTLSSALDELDLLAPGVPLIALGQTIFWDEPMKAGVAIELKDRGSDRKFYAGVHDTDYFAKAPHSRTKQEKRAGTRYKTVGHNDTTTKDVWSAAIEFSALFGSETPIKKDLLLGANVRLQKIEKARPKFLDSFTEAFRWKGVVSVDDDSPVMADVELADLKSELTGALNWALDESLTCLSGDALEKGRIEADRLKSLVESAANDLSNRTLSEFYERLLPDIYSFISGRPSHIETTRTTRLLEFNTETWVKPRFQHLELFLNPKTVEMAKKAYNDSVKGSEIYTLDRFGTGAVPFDVFLPGIGRGTLRLGNRGVVIQTPKPQFLTIKKPITSLEELAIALESKFGKNCVVIGKAVALVGMISREFCFVFNETASSYLFRSKRFHKSLEMGLQQLGLNGSLKMNPMLRLKFDSWGTIGSTALWLKLPEPLQRPFGTNDLCSPSFAERRPEVAKAELELIGKLSRLRRPLELIAFLEDIFGGSWASQAEVYRKLQSDLSNLRGSMESEVELRRSLYREIQELKKDRVRLEIEKGDHFREFIFEKNPSESDLSKRKEFETAIEKVVARADEAKAERKQVARNQGNFLKTSEVQNAHKRRQDIELEAELTRAKLVREAVIATSGLDHANFRPSAWWFPILSPDHSWYQRTIETAHCYLESLV